MLPAVAEVVLVADACPHLRHIGKPRLHLIPESEFTLRIGPVSGVADPEGVQMIILPAHSGLDHLVQPAQRKRRRDKHAPPLAGLRRRAARPSPPRGPPPSPARRPPPPRRTPPPRCAPPPP